MPELKPRKKQPNYINADRDFLRLKKLQEEYEEYFLDHLIYPAHKLHAEIARIEAEWKDKTVVVASDTKDVNIAELRDAYDEVCKMEKLRRVIINALFRKLGLYFPEMSTDNEIGYLDDEKYLDYLVSYREAIEKNRALGLYSWRTLATIDLEKMIKELLRIAY